MSVRSVAWATMNNDGSDVSRSPLPTSCPTSAPTHRFSDLLFRNADERTAAPFLMLATLLTAWGMPAAVVDEVGRSLAYRSPSR